MCVVFKLKILIADSWDFFIDERVTEFSMYLIGSMGKKRG